MSDIDIRNEIEKKLGDELAQAKQVRRRWEREWAKNEQSLYDNGDESILRQSMHTKIGGSDPVPESSQDAKDNFAGLNLNARNAELIHSQLISNVPATMAVPTNEKDREDREAAQAHEAALAHLREEKDMAAWVGISLVPMTVYGTAVLKQIIDKTAGGYDYVIDPKNPKIKKKVAVGDIKYAVPSAWDVWLDPKATSLLEVKKVWERLHFDYDSAKAFFGEEALHLVCGAASEKVMLEDSQFPVYYNGTVEIYEHWIQGSAADNYKGKLIYHLEDGRILKQEDNPCKTNMFPKIKSTTKVRVARLPYSFMPYHVVPGSPYGRSPASKCYRAQAILNQCAAVMLQTAKNIGVAKVMTTGSVVNRSSLSDDSIQVIELDMAAGDTGGGGSYPNILQGAGTSNDFKLIMEDQRTHINDQWGINDALLGKQGRETQGITMQVSLQQSNLIREWLFDNYVRYLKDIMKLSLAHAVSEWPESKWRLVLGKEDSQTLLKSAMGSDVESGYSIMLERNLLIALDPISRQEQLLRLKDVFKDAGIDQRIYMRLFRFADWRGIFTQFDYAINRGKKNIEFILTKKKLPEIYKHEDHVGIAAYLSEYVNSYEFEELNEEQKALINTLIDKRLEIEANKMAGSAPQGAAPAMPPMMMPQ
jgi:hypothetical protein